MTIEASLRPLLAAGQLKQARQRIGDYLAATQMSDPAALAEAAYWSCQANDFTTARDLYEQACKLKPTHQTYYYNLATTERILGDPDAATRALNCHLENSPDDAEALWLRCQLGSQRDDEVIVPRLMQLLNTSLPPKQQVHGHYALGKVYEDKGLYTEAFAAYEAGALLRRRYLKYDVAQDEAILGHIGSQLAEPFWRTAQTGSSASQTLFIVGMPRSGTTLVESILAAHQDVAMGGELNTFSQSLMGEVSRHQQPGSMAEAIERSGSCDLDRVGQAYEQGVKDYRGCSRWLTDKLPLNFLYLGLIKKALPASKLIYVKRNPMDTLWSVYKHLFSHAYPFSYDLSEICRYYVAQQKLMAHWQQLLGDDLLTVDYAALVGEPERISRQITQHCGITFEPSSLQFYQQKGSVTTGSAIQVREPIHSRSVGQWQHFASQLEPARKLLLAAGVPPSELS